mmetsp:Transcript_62854/g.70395  ORF Transcript_62854/g.70395 Transcript_62854/m.70395 type:complete len:155 (-) Transcript_62854:48-512(-)
MIVLLLLFDVTIVFIFIVAHDTTLYLLFAICIRYFCICCLIIIEENVYYRITDTKIRRELPVRNPHPYLRQHRQLLPPSHLRNLPPSHQLRINPTAVPTAVPKAEHKAEPTNAPTNGPTATPTDAPTEDPTGSPTGSPTGMPTGMPTFYPTKFP